MCSSGSMELKDNCYFLFNYFYVQLLYYLILLKAIHYEFIHVSYSKSVTCMNEKQIRRIDNLQSIIWVTLKHSQLL